MFEIVVASLLGRVMGIVWGVIGALAALTIVVFLIGLAAFMILLKRKPEVDYDNPPKENFFAKKLNSEDHAEWTAVVFENAKKLLEAPHEEIEITSEKGEKLFARFFPCATPTENTVVGFHGMGVDGPREFGRLGFLYLNAGFNLLLPDHAGHGKSEGDYIGFSIADRENALKWVKYAADRFPAGEIYVTGVSMGGATVLQLSGMDLPPSVKGIIADCAFSDARKIMAYQLKHHTGLPEFPMIDLVRFWCKHIAGYDINSYPPIDSVKKSKTPILFIHGSKDVLVPLFMSEDCYAVCPSKKKLLVVEDAEHARSYDSNKQLYTDTVLEFMSETKD